MGDIQQYFIDTACAISTRCRSRGYHIAEAGANPICSSPSRSPTASRIVEYYLARGMQVDDFAPNLSFFFCNGMDPEYSVIGRVARRIWAVRHARPLRRQRAQPEAQVPHPDFRPLPARAGDRVQRHPHDAAGADRAYDNCNSLHTNAYDEAITTPTEESVRRAMAIQLIINSEWGLAKNENPNQGSFIVEELTDLVEEAVLTGVRGASPSAAACSARWRPATSAARSRKSRCTTSTRSTTGRCPIVGVNTFRNPRRRGGAAAQPVELIRSTEEEKRSQLKRLREFQRGTRTRRRRCWSACVRRS